MAGEALRAGFKAHQEALSFNRYFLYRQDCVNSRIQTPRRKERRKKKKKKPPGNWVPFLFQSKFIYTQTSRFREDLSVK